MSKTAIAAKKDQKIKFENDNLFSRVYGDHRCITEIVDNLLNNAINYSPEGKDIFIKLSSREGKALLEVRDVGLGLSKDDLDNLFRPFAPLSVRLGLSTVKNLVEAHKGKIHAESDEVGKGITVIVELPLSTSSKEEE